MKRIFHRVLLFGFETIRYCIPIIKSKNAGDLASFVTGTLSNTGIPFIKKRR